jgi:hypothetical protein
MWRRGWRGEGQVVVALRPMTRKEMFSMADWSRAELIALAAFFVALLAAIAGWLVVPEFGTFLRMLGRRTKVLGRWLANNWQLVLGLIALFGLAYGACALVHTVWAAGLILGLLLAILLLARYQQTLMIFSGGEVGDFSDNRDGPWRPAVGCDPLYRDWARIEGANWVWIKERPSDQEAQSGQIVWHRLWVHIPRFTMRLRGATLRLAVDDYVNVSINGDRIRRHEIGGGVVAVDVGGILRKGQNLIEMEVENAGGTPTSTGPTNPAGIIYCLELGFGLF